MSVADVLAAFGFRLLAAQQLILVRYRANIGPLGQQDGVDLLGCLVHESFAIQRFHDRNSFLCRELVRRHRGLMSLRGTKAEVHRGPNDPGQDAGLSGRHTVGSQPLSNVDTNVPCCYLETKLCGICFNSACAS